MSPLLIQHFFDLHNPFLWLAIVWFIFFGLFAVPIFSERAMWLERWRQFRHHWHWWLYQGIFNGLGAFVGWMALAYLWSVDLRILQWEYFGVAAIAFYGITGNLPAASLLGRLLRG